MDKRRTLSAFGGLLLALAVTLPISASGPVITGHGSCGGPAYAPGTYVFFFDASPDPQGARVDITAHQLAGQPDWSPGWAILGSVFYVPDIYGGFAVTTNLGSSLFVRWTGTTDPVVRIDSSDVCPSVMGTRSPPVVWPSAGTTGQAQVRGHRSRRLHHFR